MTGPGSWVLGLGVATPALSMEQPRTLELALRLAPPRDGVSEALVRRIYERSGVESRGVAIGTSEGVDNVLRPGGRGAFTCERNAAVERCVRELAQRACTAALRDAGIASEGITHLVTTSCTGFSAPGWDIGLIESLPLARTVRRTHLGFMGCHAAINAWAVTDAFARGSSEARVLVCCAEVCSAHLHQEPGADQVVANALFADGAAAAVIAGPAASVGDDRRWGTMAGAGSLVVPGTPGSMGWTIGDHGFEMRLGSDVPRIVREQASPWVREWLGGHGLEVDAVRSWAIHPGGPRVLEAAAEGLGLSGESLAASREILRRHGNMSSPTVLFIVRELAVRHGGMLPLPAVVLSFGPGITGEALLLR